MHIRLSKTLVPAPVVTATLKCYYSHAATVERKGVSRIRCANSFGRLCQDAAEALLGV